MEPNINRLHLFLKNILFLAVETGVNAFAGTFGKRRFERFLGSTRIRLDLLEDAAAAFRTHSPFKDRLAASLTGIFDLYVSGDSPFFDHFQNGFLFDTGRFMHLDYRGPPVIPQISRHFFFIFFFRPVTVRTHS